MRSRVYRPLAVVCALVLLFTAVVQTAAFSPSGRAASSGPRFGGDAAALRLATRADGRANDRFSGPDARRQFEALRDKLDLSTLQLPAKPAYGRLDSQLNRLVERRKSGKTSVEALAEGASIAQGSSVAVTIRVNGDTTPLAAFVAAHGGRVANTGADVVEAYVPVDQLAALNDAPGVVAARAIIPPVAEVTSQGAAVHGAPNWNANGYTGAGVKVGVIDLGFQGLGQLLGSELPGNVVIRCYTDIGAYTADPSACDDGEQHGAAVAEAVMDVAPGASLYVADPISRLDMQATVQWMADQGVTVINYSAGSIYDGPGDGTSLHGDSPLKVVDAAVSRGITWVNSAGNSAESNWFGPFNDADGNGVMEFEAGQEVNAVLAKAGQQVLVQLRWADSWASAADDLGLLVMDPGGLPLAFSDEPQGGASGQEPFEGVVFTAPADGYYPVVVGRNGGPTPAWVQLQTFSDYGLAIATPDHSITTPADSANPGLLAVGAANWSTPDAIEEFSSEGPAPDGRVKPDIVGADGGDSVTYGPSGFYGTSQASPHVAGLAALVKQRFPDYTPAQVADYLKSNAIPRGDGTPNSVWGYGLAHLPEIGGGNPNPPPAGDAFDAVWATTDRAVAAGGASYSWFWGPQANHHAFEDYQESPGGRREVQYYDKSRMEINNPDGDRNSIYYVTNGLLTEELVTGRMQVGNGAFEPHAPSAQLVAGDAAGNPGTPSYAAFAPYATTDGQAHRAADRTGQEVTDYLSGAGALSATDSGGVRDASYQSATGHNMPDVFWDWANSPASGFRPDQGVDWLYVLGYPISEPYWIDATVGGTPHRVLVQLFERRVLTYTPTNPAQYQVEFGNIGQHYYQWRYVDAVQPAPEPTPSPTPPPAQYPADGATIYQPDMSTFDPYTSANGALHAYWDPSSSSYVVEDSSLITDTASSFYTWWQSSADAPQDYSITVDIVNLDHDTSGASEAGVFTRVESDDQGPTDATYSALGSNGQLGAYYLGPDTAQQLAVADESAAYHSGYGAVNTLKVIVKGDHAWVLLNGQLAQDFALDARSNVAANGFAFVTYRFDNSVPMTRFGFRNLTVRAAQ